jgi:hypothetical protein
MTACLSAPASIRPAARAARAQAAVAGWWPAPARGEHGRPGVAYRAFRDGLPLITRDARAFTERRARAILEYLDWRPIEEELTRAALEASHRG